jgi:hypothetical protein
VKALEPKRIFARNTISRVNISDFQNEEVNWTFIRAVLASVANTAIVFLQDVLGLGSRSPNESAWYLERKLEVALQGE